MTSEAMDMEAIDMANGVKHAPSAGCLHVTLGGKPETEEAPMAEFEDYPLEEKAKEPVDWQALVMKICRTVAVPLIVGMLFFWGMLRGECTKEFALPISWACSLISVFSAGVILARVKR